MVSKNNYKEKMGNTAEQHAHFGIRKLSIGAASVLLSTTLWFSGTGVVHADTQENSNDDVDQAKSATESQQSVNTQKVNKVVVDATDNSGSQDANAETKSNDNSVSDTTKTAQTNEKAQTAENETPAQNTTKSNDNVLKQDAKENTEKQKAQQSTAAAQNIEESAQIAQAAQDGQKAASTSNDLENSGSLGKQTKKSSTAKNVDITKTGLKDTNDLKLSDATKVTETAKKSAELSQDALTVSKAVDTTDKQNDKDTASNDAAKEYTVTIRQINDTEGGTFWNDNSNTDTHKLKAGDKQEVFYNYVGYKLMNPEALQGLDIENPAMGHGTLVVPDHDVTLELHYAKLSPVVVKYVDTDGNLLTTFSDSGKASTSKSVFSDQDNIEDSNFLAKAIAIPGYELVSDDSVEIPLTNTYKSKDDSNPNVITFTYKRTAEYAQDGLPEGGGADVTGNDYGDTWSNLPGGVSVDLVYDTYGSGTNHFEEQVQAMQDRYVKQGFTYLGVLNNHKDTDKMNRLQSYYSVHFLQNKPVTVNYVDEDGNKLADSVVLNFNKSNPDQTNNGINHKENWYPAGEWKSERKSFDGYVLDKVLGAESGEFTSFAYTTTYVYTKAANATINYIDDTENKTLDSDTVSGGVGLDIDYSTQDKIANYEKQGYVFVSDNFTNKNGQKYSDDATKNVFEVHLKHATVPVDPNNPDPSNPELTKDALQKTVTRTVNYLNAADHSQVLADPTVDRVIFSAAGTLDKVTGNLVTLNDDGSIKDQNGKLTWTYITSTGKTGTASSYTFDQTKDRATISANGKTYDFANTDNSEYDAGRGAVKSYTADATDPKGLTVNAYYDEEKAPAVGSVTVKFHDDTTNTDLSGVGYNSGDQVVDTPVTYKSDDDLKSLTDKGYIYVSTDGQIPEEIAEGKTNVVIHVKHGVVPVDPENPATPGEPINPSDPNSPVYPDGVDSKSLTKNITRTVNYVVDGATAPSSVKDTLTFTAKGYIDQVTGHWVNVDKDGNVSGSAAGMTWTIQGGRDDKGSFDAVVSPEVDGYHVASVSDYADGNNVRAIDVDHNNGNITITVTYTKNGHTEKNAQDILSTSTITYVDDQGNELLPATKDSFNFHKTPDEVDSVTGKTIAEGEWNATDHTYSTVNVPVINGYVANKKTAGGQTATHDNPNVVDQVVYTKVGKIVPVDPDGKQIPDAPTPVYTNDPKDPTKVTSDEPVPSIDDYTPKQNTVTPKDPTKDTEVVYTKDKHIQHASVVYQDINDPENVVILHTDKDLTGESGTKINYSPESVIDTLTKKGYVLLHDGFGDSQIFDNDDDTDQTFYVTFKHGRTTVTPDKPGHPGEPIDPSNPDGPKYPEGTGINNLKVDASQTIHYVGAGDETPSDNVQNYTFTKNITFDDVTGEIVDKGTWNESSHTFASENTPVVEGYQADKKTAGATTVTPDNPTTEVTVTYTKVDNTQHAVVIYQDVNSGTPVELATSGDLTGEAGSAINYSTAAEIKALTDKGYVLVNDGFGENRIFDNDKNTKQTFYVTFKHGQTTVTPDKPGHPGEPVDSSNPDGPKYPDGTDENSLKKTVTQTVHYQGAGNETPSDKTQSVTFTKEITFDNVTGEITKDSGWNEDSHKFSSETTPVVEGYHADKRTAGGEAVTPDSEDVTVTVTYTKNGKIVPVDSQGNKIPNVDTPTYVTDPDDPTRVTPDEAVPTIDGYTPSQNAVTPEDPAKDTDVVYTKIDNTQHAVVIYQDVNNGTPVELATSGDLTGEAGSVINYSTADEIKALTDKGYILKNDGFTSGSKFDNDKNATQTFYVTFIHDAAPVNPDHPGKPGQPINPNDPNGAKWPDGSDVVTHDVTRTINYVDNNGTKLEDSVVQTAHFTGSGIVDKVTGEWITPIIWNGNGKLNSAKTPVIAGYHVTSVSRDSKDKVNVDAATVKYNTDNYAVDVVYTKNGKIIPIDSNGNKIPNVDTPTYVTDPSDPSKVVPNEAVPTIAGYTPSQTTVTPKNAGEDTDVVYTQVVTPTPEQPSTPATPSTPSTTDTPSVPTNTTPSTPSTSVPDNTPTEPTTIQPHAQPTPLEPEQDDVSEKTDETTPVQDDETDVTTVRPHAQKEAKNSSVVKPHSAKAATIKTSSAAASSKTVSATNAKAQTLPQTGESSTDEAAAAIGAAATGLGLIGLSGIKRRKKA